MSAFSVPPEHTRHGSDPARVAIILPGGMYTPVAPLLYYATAVLLRHGWTVQEVWWTGAPDRAAAPGWVREQAAAALARESADQVLLVGKSMGTYAAGLAAERGLPAIWLTPNLTDNGVVEGLLAASKPRLLVGGTADPYWRGDIARSSGAEVLEVPDADHAMEIEDDPVRSVEILGQVTAAMDRFVAGI